MMRPVFGIIGLLCVLCGPGFGEKPVYRVGLGSVYFYPHQPVIDVGFEAAEFRTFRGLGFEAGKISGHYDLNLEAHLVSAKSTSWYWNDYAILFMVTPRVAYRFWKRRTPYIGAGSGYQLIHLRPDPDRFMEGPFLDEYHHSFAFEPFAGYDFRLTNRFGLMLEGRYQLVSPSEVPFAAGVRGSAGAYLAFGGK